MKHAQDDARFPHITYRQGAAGWSDPVIRGTAIRVQTIVGISATEGLTPAEIAREYDLTEKQVTDALAFYKAHRGEIEASMADEAAKARVYDLLNREKVGILNTDETSELDNYLKFEHVMRLAKAQIKKFPAPD